jgi:signal transduction histidine kinase
MKNRRTQSANRLTMEQRFSYINQVRRFHPYVSGHLQRVLQRSSVLFALLTILIGVAALIGWYLDITSLRSVFPSFPGMKTNTAIGIIILGFGVLLSQYDQKRRIVRYTRYFFGMTGLLIGLLTLLQYIVGTNFGIDEFFFREFSDAIGTIYPNRMAPNSSAIIMFIGASILFLDQQLFNRWIYQFFIFLATILLIPTIIGYIYDVEFIYGVATGTKMAIPTAVGFILLLFALMFARSRRGVMQLVTSDTAGGFLIRRLMIIAAILPLIIGWLMMQGYRLGLYDQEFRHLLHVSVTIILFTYLLWRNARALHAIDDSRRATEQNILFLAQVSKILSTSLDYRTTLNSVAQLTVPTIADWCAIDVLNQQGELKHIVLYHKDEKKIVIGKQLRKEFPTNLRVDMGIGKVLHTGKTEFIPVITDDMIKPFATNSRHLQLLRKIGFSSMIIVPVLAHKKPIGTMTLVTSDISRQFSESDVFIAEELASRTSLAIENAQLYHNAQDAIKVRDEFISIASHELKTPLTSLKVYAQIIQKQLKKTEDEKLITYISRLDRQIDNLAELVKDLLDISRMQLGKLDFYLDYFDLGHLVKEVVQSLQNTTAHKIRVTNKISELAFGDRERIGQIVVNFITNAVKYSPNADTVEITLSQTESHLILSVRDFGIGIDKKHQRQIFEKFFQVKDSRKSSSSGLGIGLYISNEIAARHNGKLTVESMKGKGSTFSFLLPRKRSALKSKK